MESEMREQKEEARKLREEVRELRKDKEEWEKRYVVLHERVIDQEARSRRNNLLFHGLPEGGQEEDCTSVIQNFIRHKLRLDINVDIERAHRLGAKKSDQGKPRPIIAKFLRFQQREKVRGARTTLPKGLGISEDHPQEIRDARQQLVPLMRGEGKEAWIVYPARLIVDGRLYKEISPATAAATRREAAQADGQGPAQADGQGAAHVGGHGGAAQAGGQRSAQAGGHGAAQDGRQDGQGTEGQGNNQGEGR